MTDKSDKPDQPTDEERATTLGDAIVERLDRIAEAVTPKVPDPTEAEPREPVAPKSDSPDHWLLRPWVSSK